MNKLENIIFKTSHFLKMFFVVLRRDGFSVVMRRTRETIFIKFIAKSKFFKKYEQDLYFSKNSSLAKVVFKDNDCMKKDNSIDDRSVDVIVCVHNALEDVKRCLESVLAKNTIKNMKLIIVDDGSGDETRDFLADFARNNAAKLVRNEKALGYTFAANIGLRESRGDYAILLNSDTIVTSGWLEKMIACAQSDSRIGLVGPLSNTASWQSVPKISEDGDWADNPLPEGITLNEWGDLIERDSGKIYPRMPFLNGFCLMIKKEVIMNVGYFDEETFGKGFGEENDYCLRARKNGWALAVADDVYIYHAQSKSYSSEKRIILCEAADKNLAKKHGRKIIQDGVLYCQNNRVMEGIRARIDILPQLFTTHKEIKNKYEGKTILFVLPVTDAGGGGNVVVSEAQALADMGIKVTLLNLIRNKDAFKGSYPELELEVLYAKSESDIKEKGLLFDAVVATANFTATWIAPIDIKEDVILGYYAQDYEPLFYKSGTKGFFDAEKSYELVPRMKIFSKTVWNKEMIENNHPKKVAVIGPSYNSHLFRPCSGKTNSASRSVRIIAMIRPSSPRRNAKMTMEILKSVKIRFGNRVDIVIFGLSKDELRFAKIEKKFNFTNLGKLNPLQVSRLFNESDIFVDFSTYQAMGLASMEAMASGLAVIVPKKGGGDSFAINGENSLMVDTSDVNTSRDALFRLINDADLREKLSKEAIRSIPQFHPDFSAANMAKVLFD
jgi:GT2 family glycosyltransferase